LESLKGRDHSGNLGGKCKNNIKIDIKNPGCERVNWIDMAQNRDQWRPYCVSSAPDALIMKMCAFSCVSDYIVPKREVMTVGDNWSRTAVGWIVNFEEE
jgi:hypothetical protein